MKHIIPLFILSLLFTGCHSSSKTIADHFEHLHQIAEANANDCNQMASALNQYLDQHEASLRTAVADVSQAKPNEASEIWHASTRLHQSITKCQSGDLDRFKERIADIVIREVVTEE